MDTGAARRRRRVVAIIGLLAAVAVPLGGAVASVWSTTGSGLAAVRAERRGVVYQGQTLKLLMAVADAQTAAVHGDLSESADLRAAVEAVDQTGLASDPDPGTGTLWAQVRPQVLALAGHSPTGASAYQAYSQATDLVLQLTSDIDDASGLVLDPGTDANHLVEALTLLLPDMVVEAGRFDDLTALDAQGSAASVPGSTSTAAIARTAVVRDRIAVDAHSFATALNKVFRSTASATLGPHLLGDVDLVNTDVDALAPTASVIDEAIVVPASAEVSADRQAFDPAVLVLETAGLSELDILLTTREIGYEQQRTHMLYLLFVGAAVAGPSLWWLCRRRSGSDDGDLLSAAEPTSTARVGRRPGRLPVLRGRPQPVGEPGVPVGDAANRRRS
jgi:PPE-repeat protein